MSTVMISKSASTSGNPVVPSRNALRVLRRLAVAGSTVGSFCAVATITYDVHRRVRLAEHVVENKRALQTSAPNYDATSAAKRLSRMMESAEAGEYMGMEYFKEKDRKLRNAETTRMEGEGHAPGFDANGVIETAEGSARVGDFLPAAKSPLGSGLNPKQGPKPSVRLKDLKPSIRLKDLTPLERLQFTGNIHQSWVASWRHSTTSATELEGDLESSALDGDACTRQMKELLDHERPIDAAQVFLDSHPATLAGISSERRKLALHSFYINCKQNNVFVARSVFSRLEDVDRVSAGMWSVMMFALATNGCVESVATIYTRYMHKFNVPPELVDVVLRCLLESHRLTTAKWFLLRNIQVDKDCGLSGVYLTGLWRKTRSIELLNGQLRKLLTVLPRAEKQPTDKLFNPMLKAYIEFGRYADAEALVCDMEESYKIPRRCRTRGLLAYGKALACDWPGVEADLKEMYGLNMMTRRRDFLPVFDRIFLEYWVSHSGPEIRDFVIRHVKEHNIIPDRVLYKHILEAFVEKGDEAMIKEFTQLGLERSWNIHIKEEQFLEMLRKKRLSLEGSPVGFWQMLRAARKTNGQVATSQQVLGYDQHSFPDRQINVMPYTHQVLPWYQRKLEAITPSKPVDQYQALHKQMAHYMHVGKLREALDCFEASKRAGFHFKQLHLELAVVSTLLEYGLDAAQALIEAEWQNIRHLVRFFPQFFRQITEFDCPPEGEIIKTAVLRFYSLCWHNKSMNVKHHITVATSRRLILIGKPELAVDLLITVYKSRYTRVSAFNGTCMKMFARAFASQGNMQGIRWCILTALARGTAMSHGFVVEICRVLGVLEGQLKSNQTTKEETSERARQLRYLRTIATMLEKKSNGDTELWKVRADPVLIRDNREELKQPLGDDILYNDDNIVHTIRAWDEQYELEAALGLLDTDRESIAVRWTERRCSEPDWPEREAGQY